MVEQGVSVDVLPSPGLALGPNGCVWADRDRNCRDRSNRSGSSGPQRGLRDFGATSVRMESRVLPSRCLVARWRSAADWCGFRLEEQPA